MTMKIGFALAESGATVGKTQRHAAFYRYTEQHPDGYVIGIVSDLGPNKLTDLFGHLNVPMRSIGQFIPYDSDQGHGRLQKARQIAIGMRLGGAALLFDTTDVDVVIAGPSTLFLNIGAGAIEAFIANRPRTDDISNFVTLMPFAQSQEGHPLLPGDAGLIISRGAFEKVRESLPTWYPGWFKIPEEILPDNDQLGELRELPVIKPKAPQTVTEILKRALDYSGLRDMHAKLPGSAWEFEVNYEEMPNVPGVPVPIGYSALSQALTGNAGMVPPTEQRLRVAK